MTGTLPLELWGLINLQSLNLIGNGFSGTISPAIGQLCKLRFIGLALNRLSGILPATLFSLTNLQSLQMQQNSFYGAISSDIGNLTRLECLDLRSNQFTGVLAATVGALTQLRYLSTSQNSLISGPMPNSLQKLTNLESLILSRCNLSGKIPDLPLLTSLMFLDLSFNSFTGTIPSGLSKMENLRDLQLTDNCLAGTISKSIFTPNLSAFFVSNNFLIGTIPRDISNSADLQFLNFSSNQLTGSLPSEIALLTALQKLSICDTSIGGSLPREFGLIQQIEIFELRSNNLRGAIELDFGNTTSIWGIVDFSHNSFTGTIPAGITNVIINSIDISYNMLRGPIEAFAQLPHAQVIILSNNEFSGTIPLFSSYGLLVLYLDSNHLTGSTLPININHTHFESLSISDNCLDSTSIQLNQLCDIQSLKYVFLDNIGNGCQAQQQSWMSFAISPPPKIFPICIWSMPVLNTLSVAGNAFSFRMPSESELSAPLESLNIANNIAYGTLPSTLLSTSPDISTVYLTCNRISGSLPSASTSYNYSLTLDFTVNRLSCNADGFLASIGNFAESVSVLSGNLFLCSSSLFGGYSSVDKNSDAVVCDSFVFYASSTAILIIVSLLVFLVSAKGCTMDMQWSEYLAAILCPKRSGLEGIGKGFILTTIKVELFRWWLLSTALTIIIVIVLLPVYTQAPHLYTCIGGWYGSLINVRPFGGLWVLVPVVCILYLLSLSLLSSEGRISSNSGTSLSNVSRVILACMILLIVFINIVYVIVSTSTAVNSALKRVTQIVVSILKLLFSTTIPLFLMQKFGGEDIRTKIFHKRVLFILCSLAATVPSILPCIVSSLSNNECFYDLIRPPPPLVMKLPVSVCDYSEASYCARRIYEFRDIESEVPFLYSFTCGGSTMTSYAPLLSTTCLMTLLSSAISVVLPMVCKSPLSSKLLNYRNCRIYRVFPVVMWHYWDKIFVNNDLEWYYNDVSIDIVVQFVMLLAMQLSFGVALPFLSVVIWVTMTILVVLWVHVFTSICASQPTVVESLTALPSIPKSVFRMLGFVMAFTLGWLLVDQLDNSDPAMQRSFISVVVCALLCFMAMLSRSWLLWFKPSNGPTKPEVSTNDVEMSQVYKDAVENPMF